MLTIEEEAIAGQGITLNELMERAGAATAAEARNLLPQPGRVLIFCGGGNNGGDGYVAARLLAGRKYQVEIAMLVEPAKLAGAAAAAFAKIAADEKIAKIPISARRRPKTPDLIIDALFGFGLRGAVRGAGAKAIKLINSIAAPVLAVDIPSGVNSDTGGVESEAVMADRTITFTAPKAGMAIYPGLEHTGTIRVADIGIDKQIVARHTNICLGSRALVRRLLPKRRPDTHKGDCGRALIIAGSVGMTGAAAMCSRAAMRSGAGLVTLAVPESLNDILETKTTEVMTMPLPETPERSIRAKALDTIMEIAPDFDVVAVGPGLSTNTGAVNVVRQLVTLIETPLVVDADGLNALVGQTSLLAKRPGQTILTPHPGELGRLLAVPTATIQADRLQAAQTAATAFGATVVLKGARTVISDKNCLYINPTGNPGLASAGTGDILCGLIAGLTAQGLPVYPASILGAYLHGRAGDLAAKDLSELALVATDLLDYLPAAVLELV